MNKPVFLMAFSNDRRQYLETAGEQDEIRKALSGLMNFCQFEPISDLTPEKLINAIQQLKPTLFHYAGHADQNSILLGSGVNIESSELAKVITYWKDVKLVFLNGCSTDDHAQAFLNKGVQHVIITNKKINDGAAVLFASKFYEKFGEGKTVPEAFDFAKMALRFRLTAEYSGSRGIGFDVNTDEPIWDLRSREGQDPWRWQIQALGRVKADRLTGEGLASVKIRKDVKNIGETDAEGFFNIDFEKSQLGKEYQLELEKPNYKVVNEADLTFVPDLDGKFGSKRVEIVMCHEDKYEKARKKFLIDKYQTNLNDQSIVSRQITSEKLEGALAQVENVAKLLAGIDLSTAKDQLKKAMRLMESLKFEEAIGAIDDQKLESDLHSAEELSIKASEQRKMVVDSWLVKAMAHLMNFEFDQAKKYYLKAMEADPENFKIRKDYINFLYKQNEYQAAEDVCKKGLTEIGTTVDELMSIKGELLHQNGKIRFRLDSIPKAKSYFRQAKEILEGVIKNKRSLLEELNILLNKKLHLITKSAVQPEQFLIPEMEASFAEILGLMDRINKIDLLKVEGLKAATLNNLGKLLSNEREFDAAEKSLKQSLAINKHYYEKGTTEFLPYLALNFNDLGELFAAKGQVKVGEKNIEEGKACYIQAAENYSKALEHRKELAKSDSASYGPDKAMTLLNFGKLYSYQLDFCHAEELYQQAIEILNPLAYNNPAAYGPDLATACHNFGKLYNQIGRQAETIEQKSEKFRQAEDYYNKAESIRRELKEGNDAYKDEYTATLHNFGVLYGDLKNYAKAILMLEKAKSFDEELIAKNSKKYHPYFAACCYELGLVYVGSKEFDKAKAAFDQVITVGEHGEDVLKHYLDMAKAEREQLLKRLT